MSALHPSAHRTSLAAASGILMAIALPWSAMASDLSQQSDRWGTLVWSDHQPDADAATRKFLGAASEAELRSYNTGPIMNAATSPMNDQPDEPIVGSRETADAVPNEAASGAPDADPYWVPAIWPRDGYDIRFGGD
jgi:hypothetical protein